MRDHNGGAGEVYGFVTKGLSPEKDPTVAEHSYDGRKKRASPYVAMILIVMQVFCQQYFLDSTPLISNQTITVPTVRISQFLLRLNGAR